MCVDAYFYNWSEWTIYLRHQQCPQGMLAPVFSHLYYFHLLTHSHHCIDSVYWRSMEKKIRWKINNAMKNANDRFIFLFYCFIFKYFLFLFYRSFLLLLFYTFLSFRFFLFTYLHHKKTITKEIWKKKSIEKA